MILNLRVEGVNDQAIGNFLAEFAEDVLDGKVDKTTGEVEDSHGNPVYFHFEIT